MTPLTLKFFRNLSLLLMAHIGDEIDRINFAIYALAPRLHRIRISAYAYVCSINLHSKLMLYWIEYIKLKHKNKHKLRDSKLHDEKIVDLIRDCRYDIMRYQGTLDVYSMY